MKYALLAYDFEGSLDELPAEDKAALHAAHSTMHEDETAQSRVTILAHYRFRPQRLTTTVRITPDGPLRTDAPASAQSENLRALYVLEADDIESVTELATQLPAVQHGAIIEIRPLTEPDEGVRGSSPREGFAARHRPVRGTTTARSNDGLSGPSGSSASTSLEALTQ